MRDLPSVGGARTPSCLMVWNRGGGTVAPAARAGTPYACRPRPLVVVRLPHGVHTRPSGRISTRSCRSFGDVLGVALAPGSASSSTVRGRPNRRRCLDEPDHTATSRPSLLLSCGRQHASPRFPPATVATVSPWIRSLM
jgi:hypothetical protein